MPWKKAEGGGIATQEQGGELMPVWVKDDGTEVVVDGEKNLGAIARLTSENQARREHNETLATENEELKRKHKPFEGMNPDEVRKALDGRSKANPSDLEKQLSAEQAKVETLSAQLAEATSAVEQKDAQIRQNMVNARFSASAYFSGPDAKTVLLPDIAERYFGPHFQVEGDKVVAYKDAGTFRQPIYSEKHPGEPADFDEAVGFLVNSHPHKDRLLAGSGASGSGAPANGHRPREGAEDNSKLPSVVRLQKAFDSRAAS